MNPVLLMGEVVAVLVVIAVGTGVLLHRKSFKNRAFIARQTGKDPSDVVWIEDRFRVRSDSGFWVISFLNMRERTSSVDGSFWTKFLQKKKSKKTLRYTKEEWHNQEISRQIQRGLFFYENSEGEFFPMRIEESAGKKVFSVVNQDNRQFLIQEIKDINSLTRSKKHDMMMLGGIIVACLVLALIFIFGIIYMSESARDTLVQSQTQCIEYWRQINNISQGNPTFLSQVTTTVGG